MVEHSSHEIEEGRICTDLDKWRPYIRLPSNTSYTMVSKGFKVSLNCIPITAIDLNVISVSNNIQQFQYETEGRNYRKKVYGFR